MSAQSRILFIAVLASLMLISGCKKDYYDLDMVPEGDTLHRTLVVEPDEEALAALEALYGHAPILIAGETPGETSGGKPPAKYKFEGSFKMLTPNDIGGSGYLLYCDSIMGSASMYSEQFRGDDDLAAALERQEIAINGLFDIVILWLESEFADSQNFPVLCKAIDENLRSDFWNLSLYLSTFSSIGKAVDGNGNDPGGMLLQQVGMRTLHFLIERGYFEVSELPKIMTSLSEFDGESMEMISYMARAVANLMGMPKDDPLPEPLDLMVKDFEGYLDSAERFFDTDEVERLATDAFAGSFRLAGSGGEYLRANMRIPNEPYITNGEWDEEGELRWRKSLPRVDTTSYDLPVLIYAFWSDPDRDFQNEHFGREVLFEESLGDYCYWRNHLTKKQGKKWDSFVASLDPDEKLLERLTDFQFKGEPDRLEGISYHKDVKSGVALAVIVDILEELKKARESSPE